MKKYIFIYLSHLPPHLINHLISSTTISYLTFALFVIEKENLEVEIKITKKMRDK